MPGQWTFSEDLRYHFFLILNINRFFPKPRKNDAIFKHMESFLRSKNSQQCRSHHQKRIGKDDLKAVLKTFYYEHYEIRLLDISHCKLQMSNYLTRINPAYIRQTSIYQQEITIQTILDVFENNCRALFQTEPVICQLNDQATQTLLTQDKYVQTEEYNEVNEQNKQQFERFFIEESNQHTFCGFAQK